MVSLPVWRTVRVGAMTGTNYWDAESYHRVADPQFEWSKRLLTRLQLRGDDRDLAGRRGRRPLH